MTGQMDGAEYGDQMKNMMDGCRRRRADVAAG